MGSAVDELILLFLILVGTIQGCPLAGTMFAICMDPIIDCLASLLASRNAGVLCACADDLGFALSSITILPELESIFSLVAKPVSVE